MKNLKLNDTTVSHGCLDLLTVTGVTIQLTWKLVQPVINNVSVTVCLIKDRTAPVARPLMTSNILFHFLLFITNGRGGVGGGVTVRWRRWRNILHWDQYVWSKRGEDYATEEEEKVGGDEGGRWGECREEGGGGRRSLKESLGW